MCWERTVLQTLWNVHPSEAILVQNKWRIAALTIQPGWLALWFIIRRLVLLKIGNVEPSPFSRVPPDQFLTLTPRFTGRLRAGTIVNDASITRPTKAPAVAEVISRFSRVRLIHAVAGEDT